jgi:hypothetical protein
MARSIDEIRVRRDRLRTSRWAASTEENDGELGRMESCRRSALPSPTSDTTRSCTGGRDFGWARTRGSSAAGKNAGQQRSRARGGHGQGKRWRGHGCDGRASRARRGVLLGTQQDDGLPKLQKAKMRNGEARQNSTAQRDEQ